MRLDLLDLATTSMQKRHIVNYDLYFMQLMKSTSPF